MQRRTNIRAANNNDKRAIIKLLRGTMPYDHKYVKRYLDQYFSDSPATDNDLLLVYDNGTSIFGVIGFCQDYFSTDYSYYVSWLAVNKKLQGENNGALASCLMSEVIKTLRLRRAQKLFVNTTDEPERCHSFYLKQGFQFEARLKDYYEAGEDMLVFGLRL